MKYIIIGIVCFIIGILVGAFCFSFWLAGRLHGNLIITKSEDGGLPYFSLDMWKYPHGIEKKKFAVFKIKTLDPGSHE